MWVYDKWIKGGGVWYLQCLAQVVCVYFNRCGHIFARMFDLFKVGCHSIKSNSAFLQLLYQVQIIRTHLNSLQLRLDVVEYFILGPIDSEGVG